MKFPDPLHSSYPPPRVMPTVYHYTTFRSRLEARWAVFFDCLGIKWTYEPDGYALGRIGYLPDFQIDENTFAEVKPAHQSLRAFEKAGRFALQTGYRMLLLHGQPDSVCYGFIERDIALSSYQPLTPFVFNQWPDYMISLPLDEYEIGEPVEAPEHIEQAIEAACSERFGT